MVVGNGLSGGLRKREGEQRNASKRNVDSVILELRQSKRELRGPNFQVGPPGGAERERERGRECAGEI